MIGVLTSVVGAFYYLRIIKVMYFDRAEPAFDPRGSSLSFVGGVGALVTTFFFVFPAPIVGRGAERGAAAVRMTGVRRGARSNAAGRRRGQHQHRVRRA